MALADIRQPSDLRALTLPQLEALAEEIREFVVSAVSETGGHLGSNLGAVELTLALHRVFDSPRDAICGTPGIKPTFTKLSLAGAQVSTSYVKPTESLGTQVARKAFTTSLKTATRALC